MIEAVFETFDMLDTEIQFEFMTGAAAGHGSECRIGLAPKTLDTLGAPENEGQFQQAHVFLAVDTVGTAAVDDFEEVVADGQVFEIRRQLDDDVRYRILEQRRLFHTGILVCLVVGIRSVNFMHEGSSRSDLLFDFLFVHEISFPFYQRIISPLINTAAGLVSAANSGPS